ncbi:hypothetical protein EIP86_008205 [Pleurotus ostreatoroseus]|nr:hypothetical protein EIP86_008205 [Pleurotus ostreatoroseus]
MAHDSEQAKSQPPRSRGESAMNATTSSAILTDHNRASIHAYLERDLKDAPRVDFDLFAKAVFGLDPDTFKDWTLRIREKSWIEDPIIRKRMGEFCNTSTETGRYEPVAGLLNRIIELARDSLPGIDETYPIDDICVARTDSLCVQTIPEHGPLGALRKPDLVMIRAIYAQLLKRLASTNAAAPGIKWSHNLISFELKVRKALSDLFLAMLEDRRQKHSESRARSDPVPRPLAGNKRSAEDNLKSFERKPAPPERSASSEMDSANRVDAKKDARLQAGSYALETLACTYGTRLFCVNVILDDDRIHLWYYDACGAVRTENTISLIDDFEKAAALIAGMANCPPERLGALPSFMRPPPSAPYPSGWPPESLTDHSLMLHGGKEISITLKEPIFTQYSLSGRRTFVYNVERNRDISDEDMIIKMSYQVSTRTREQDLVAIARKAGVEHLPRVHQSGDLFKMSDGVRRIFNEQARLEYEDRTLRMIVYSRYFPLQSLVSEHPECLRDMAVQIIGCLHDLKEKANILHRDISVNNIMYELREGKPYFVLIDYDMAVHLPDSGGRRKQHAKYREGTLPFMAVDLIRNIADPEKDPTPHFLRHDYEAVFWLSVWCPAVFTEPTNEEEQKAKKRNVGMVRAWETRDFTDIADSKNLIRHGPLRSRLHLFGKATCLRPWIRRWIKFWKKIDAALDDMEDALDDANENGLTPPTFDFETVGGLFTRDGLLSALTTPSRTDEDEDEDDQLCALGAQYDEPAQAKNLLSHIFPDRRDGRPRRRAAQKPAATSTRTEPATAPGKHSAPTVATRKASSRKVETARGKPLPSSPTGRKKTAKTRAKVDAVKVAKKADSKKVGAKDKAPRAAGNTKSRSARSKATASDKDPPVPNRVSEDTEARIDRHGAEKPKTRGGPTTTATTTRKMTSRNVGTATKNSAPEGRRTRSVATREATAVEKKATKKNTKTTTKAAKAQTVAAPSGPTKTTRSQTGAPSARDDMLLSWPAELDENDIRRRLRPRKRT